MSSRLGSFHHIGITVSDFERSLDFYTRVLGFELVFRSSASGEELSQAVGVPGADLLVAFLRVGSDYLELLHYLAPGGVQVSAHPNDPAATHIAFRVDDMAATLDRLKAENVPFVSAPLPIGEGPLAGSTFVYFHDPDGVTLELFSPGSGVA